MKALKVLWCGFLTIPMIAILLNQKFMAENWKVFSGITPLIILQNLLVIACVIAVFTSLNKVALFFKWSWFSLLNEPSQNINLIPLEVKYFGLVFAVMFALTMPQYTHMEEEWFRQGTLSWQQGLEMSLIFGLMHCLVGVSLAAGLAIGVAGLWFTHQYFIGGIELSTVHHTTYNLILISVFFLFLLLRHVAEWNGWSKTKTT
jgi:hypothetical protein